MNDREILDRLERSWRNARDFFSNEKKEERERWVVSEFLSILDIEHQESELLSLTQDNDVDVVFREARFQVKEITDPELLRSKQIKEIHESIKSANSINDVTWAGDAQDCPAPTRMYDLIREQTEELSKKYSSSQKIDLLFYITRTFASLVQQDEIDSSHFKSLGWRSIACVNSKQAVVLFFSHDSPEFMRTGSIINRFSE